MLYIIQVGVMDVADAGAGDGGVQVAGGELAARALKGLKLGAAGKELRGAAFGVVDVGARVAEDDPPRRCRRR